MPFNTPAYVGNQIGPGVTRPLPATGLEAWPVPDSLPPPPAPPPDTEPVPQPLRTNEAAGAAKKVIVGLEVLATMPAGKKPVSPAISPLAYTAGSLAYNVLGGGIAQGHVKVSPAGIAAWFAAPQPFGFEDPRAYGLNRNYQLGNVPIRPLEIFDTVVPFVREHTIGPGEGPVSQQTADQLGFLRGEQAARQFADKPTQDLVDHLAFLHARFKDEPPPPFIQGEAAGLFHILSDRLTVAEDKPGPLPFENVAETLPVPFPADP